MSISAKQVMDLRAATGMPMMKCKKALENEDGDFEKAVERLRKEGLKAADVRADRKTAYGTVRVRIDDEGRSGTAVAVACETEPVADNDTFREFADRLLVQVAEKRPDDVDALLAQPWMHEEDGTVDEVLRGLIARIGENIKIQEIAAIDLEGPGLVGSYVHFTNRAAAMVALGSEKADADLPELAKNLCMHIVFAKPTALARSDVPAEVAEKEAQIVRAQVEQDPKMAKKPPPVIEKIVEGKLGAFYQQHVLPEQAWAVDPTLKATVADVLAQHGARVLAFRRFQIGA